jgi:predicted transcriptional regulator
MTLSRSVRVVVANTRRDVIQTAKNAALPASCAKQSVRHNIIVVIETGGLRKVCRAPPDP